MSIRVLITEPPATSAYAVAIHVDRLDTRGRLVGVGLIRQLTTNAFEVGALLGHSREEVLFAAIEAALREAWAGRYEPTEIP